MGKNKGPGFIIGAIIGAVAGLLLAPKSGKQSRAELQARTDEFKDKATDLGDEARTTGSRWFKKAKDVATTTREALEAESELEAKIKKGQIKRKAKNLGKDIKKTVKKKA